MKVETPESLVVQFVGLIYRNANSGKGHSWQILNGALSTAVRNAITAHLKFEANDFSELYSKFSGGYWFGTDSDGNGMGGNFYCEAVNCQNSSACQSYEDFREMKPYLFLGQRLCIGSEIGLVDDEKLAAGINRMSDPKDLDLVKSLRNQGYRWHVTSLGNDQIGFCAYYRDGNAGHQTGKPTKRMAWTHEELDAFNAKCRALMRERVKALKAERELAEAEKK